MSAISCNSWAVYPIVARMYLRARLSAISLVIFGGLYIDLLTNEMGNSVDHNALQFPHCDHPRCGRPDEVPVNRLPDLESESFHQGWWLLKQATCPSILIEQPHPENEGSDGMLVGTPETLLSHFFQLVELLHDLFPVCTTVFGSNVLSVVLVMPQIKIVQDCPQLPIFFFLHFHLIIERLTGEKVQSADWETNFVSRIQQFGPALLVVRRFRQIAPSPFGNGVDIEIEQLAPPNH